MKVRITPDNALSLPVEIDVNPLDVAETHEFNRKGIDKPDYRVRAFNRCLKDRVQFNSTANNLFDMARRLIMISCPHCDTTLNSGNGGGSSDGATLHFSCKQCGTDVIISLPWNGINIKPKNPAE